MRLSCLILAQALTALFVTILRHAITMKIRPHLRDVSTQILVMTAVKTAWSIPMMTVCAMNLKSRDALTTLRAISTAIHRIWWTVYMPYQVMIAQVFA